MSANDDNGRGSGRINLWFDRDHKTLSSLVEVVWVEGFLVSFSYPSKPNLVYSMTTRAFLRQYQPLGPRDTILPGEGILALNVVLPGEEI